MTYLESERLRQQTGEKPAIPKELVSLLPPANSYEDIPEEYRSTPTVANYIPGAKNPSSTLIKTSKNPGDLWEQLGVGGYAGLNSALLGLPDLLVKTADSDTYKKLIESRAKNQDAANIGGVAGDIASFLIPGGGLVGAGLKGLSKVSGLGKVAKLAGEAEKALNATGGTLVDKIGRGIAQSGAVAIPKALTGAATTGEFDPTELALETAAGGAIGAGLHGLGKIAGSEPIQKLLKPLKKVYEGLKDEAGKTLEDAVLSGADIKTGTVLKYMNQQASRLGIDRTGNMFNNVDDVKKKTADFLVKNNLLDKLTREDFLGDQGTLWKNFAQVYNKTPLNIDNAGFIAKVMDNPLVEAFAKREAVGPDKIASLFTEMTGDMNRVGGDYNNIKNYLTDITKEGRLAGDALGNAKVALARSIDDIVDEHALSLDPDLAKLKKDYPIVKLLKMASGKEQAIIENPINEGSDTFKKAAIGFGLGTGGAIGLGNDEDKANAIGTGIMGAIGVPMASRLLSKIGTQALAGGAGKVREGIEAVGPAIGQAVQAGKEQLPNVLTKTPAMVEVPKTDPEEAQLKAPRPQQQGTPAGQPVTPQVPQQSPEFASALQSRLQKVYTSRGFDRYDDFDSFVRKVQAQTNGFDPKYLSKILYDDPDMQKKFKKDFMLASQIKQLPVAEIINSMGNWVPVGPEIETATSQLEALLNNGKPMSKSDREDFVNNIVRIKKLPPQKQDLALKSLMKSNYDIDFDELTRLGVV